MTQANRAYDLQVTRDTIEVVEIASGEVVLFWDTAPAQTRRLARGLRADLAQLDAQAFMAKWRRWQAA